MQSNEVLLSRYGVESPSSTPVPAIVLQFLQWLSDNHWTTAVEICPWDGEEGVYFGSHSAVDVVQDFASTDNPDYDDLIDFVSSYFMQELAKEDFGADPVDDEPDFDFDNEPDFDAIEEDAAMRADLDAYAVKQDEISQMMLETAAEAAEAAAADAVAAAPRDTVE